MKAVRDVRPVSALTKVGVFPLMGIYPWNLATPIRYQPDLKLAARAQTRRPKAGYLLHLQQQRHNFAIEALPGNPQTRARPYLYMCVRCKWTFRVNDRPGSILTVDQNGVPLAEPENSRRVATFAVGPCPALRVLVGRQTVHISKRGWLARMKLRAGRSLMAIWERWSGQKQGRPTDPQATTAIMAQDLLR